MKFVGGKDAADFLDNFVYRKKQVNKYAVDLTAGRIYRVTGVGELDFGGSEFKSAGRKLISPVKKKKEDSYGWWELEPGVYMAVFNEVSRFARGHRAVVQPHEHLIASGNSHPVLVLHEGDKMEVPLNIAARVRIKQNARISRMYLIG
ncbi:MAG: hypothetical protein JXJ19_01040 [Elusimicrobia bacterium]|nr:hypothetical protein [Elusimicrobiota bacterium]